MAATHTVLHRSFGSFVDHVTSTPAVDGWGYLASRKAATAQFHRRASWEDAVRLSRYGWREGLDMIDGRLGVIAAKRNAIAKRQGETLQPAGFLPHIGAFASGHPLCMYQRSAGVRQLTQTIRVSVQASCPWTIDAADLTNYGAAVLMLIEAIERRGDTIDVIACYDQTGSRRSKLVYRVRIKSPGQRIDRDRLAFAMVHPAMFRRLIFAGYEAEEWCRDHGMTSSYGYPSFHETDADGIRICNSATRRNAKTVESAIDDVMAQYNEQAKGEKINV